MSILVDGMCSICCHIALVLAFMHLYINIFNLQLFLSIPKGLTFGLCLYVLLLYIMCMFCIVFQCVRFELVKSPEVTLCRAVSLQ